MIIELGRVIEDTKKSEGLPDFGGLLKD